MQFCNQYFLSFVKNKRKLLGHKNTSKIYNKNINIGNINVDM